MSGQSHHGRPESRRRPVPHMSVWRTPDEESIDVYPGLTVHDGRVSGSITIGRTRLALWAVLADVVNGGWADVELDYGPTGWSESEFLGFLGNLLGLRGEFARLLCVLADVERIEDKRVDEVLSHHEGVVDVTPGAAGAVELPGAWWADEELKARVVDHLRRCLATLESEVPKSEDF